MSPFCLEVAQLYARETVQKLCRCKMDDRARRAEIRSLAPLIAEAWRRRPDWSPAGGRALRASEVQ